MSRNQEDMAISNAELAQMTKELDELHNDQTFPAMQAAVREVTEELRTGVGNVSGRRSSRRTFLLGMGGAAAGGVLLAACSSSTTKPPSTSTTVKPAGSTSTTMPSGQLTGDLRIAALAASLENLGVFAYRAGIAAATAGKLGAVPPAVPVFATTAMDQHIQHAAAWNSVLTSASKPAVTKTDPALTPTVKQMFAKVKTVPELAALALEIENIAAQTYQGAIAALDSTKAQAIAATIQPVEMQHAAILYFVLGKYPGIQTASGTPLAFNPTTLAQAPSTYQG